jgi:hypothetical protein
MDALDYTPEQALADASELVANNDFDGAIVILFSGLDSPETDLTHFISGATNIQLVSILEMVKTKLALRTLGLDF